MCASRLTDPDSEANPEKRGRRVFQAPRERHQSESGRREDQVNRNLLVSEISSDFYELSFTLFFHVLCRCVQVARFIPIPKLIQKRVDDAYVKRLKKDIKAKVDGVKISLKEIEDLPGVRFDEVG